MSVHQRLGPPVGQPAPSRSNVPRTSGNIIDGDVRIGRGGRFQEGPSTASHQSTTGGPSRSAHRSSPPRHFNGPASAGPAGPMHHNGAGGYAGTNPRRRPPPLDAASSTSEERIVQICANHSLLIEFKNERCKQSPAHTQSHGASGHTAAAGGGGGIQHSASAPRGNASQNRVSAASSRSRTQHQRSAASQQEPGPAPHRGYSHQPPPPLQTADVAAPSRLPAARTLATQQPQSGQPFTKRGSDGRKNGPSRPRMHHEDARQQSPMQQEFDYLPPSWGKGNSQGQSQDSQLQVEERAPANVRGRGGAGGGRGSHRERQAPSIRQSARGGGRRQISERADKGEVQSPRPARGEKAVPPTTEADERPGGLADSSGRPANQQRRGRGYASSRRRGGRARLTAKPAKSTNGEPSTENPAAPSNSAPPSQPKTATAAAPAGDEDSVAGDIEQLRLQIDMKNGAGQPTTNHSETALEQRAEFEGDESTEGESEDESSSSSESEFTEDTEEEEEEEEDEEDQDQEPSLTEKPDVPDEKTLKQAPEPNAEEQATVSPHGDMDSKAASESTMDDPNEDATAEATEDIQSGDEEKTTEQQHSEADTPTVPPTPKAKVVEQETTSLQGSTDSKAASESTSSGRDEETATEATENIQSGDKEVATPQQHSEPDIPTMPESKVEEQETTSSHGDTDSKPADESSLGGLNVDATAEATENRKSGYEEAETAQQHSEPDTPTTSPTPESKVKEQETTSSQGDADSKPTDESTSDAPNGDATAEATENIQSGGEEKATPQQHTEPDTSTPPPTVSSTASHDADHSPEEDMGNSEGHTEEPSNDLDETHRSSQGSNRAPTPQQTSTKPQEPQSPASNDTNCTVVNHPTGSGDNPEKSPRSPKDTHESNSKSNPVSTPQRVSTSNRKSKRGSTKDTSHPDVPVKQ